MDGEANLKNFVVGSLPTLIYIPNFISDSEQIQLLHHIYQTPISKWKSLKNRRLQNWGGVVHEKGLLPQALPPWLEKFTKRICEETELFPSAINHVLINEYLPDQGIMPHQDGPAYFPVVAILSLGSSAVMNFTPHSRLKICTNTLTSIAEDTSIDRGVFEGESDEPFSVLLTPCSLLIFKDMAYSDYLHGIEDSNVHLLDEAVNLEDQPPPSPKEAEAEGTEQPKSIQRTTTRVSLTCRLVLKVHKKLFKF